MYSESHLEITLITLTQSFLHCLITENSNNYTSLREQTGCYMSRLKERSVLGRIYRFLSLVFKNLFSIVTMRRLLTRVINRVLLRELLTPAMGFEAETQAHGRRRMVSSPPLHFFLPYSSFVLFRFLDNDATV